MSVSHDHATVKAVISRFTSRHNLDLCGEEIILLNSILCSKDIKNVCLDTILHLFFVFLIICSLWNTSNQQIEILALDHLGSLLLHLVSRQMDQQIAHAKYRIPRLVADINLNCSSILLADDTVKSHR